MSDILYSQKLTFVKSSPIYNTYYTDDLQISNMVISDTKREIEIQYIDEFQGIQTRRSDLIILDEKSQMFDIVMAYMVARTRIFFSNKEAQSIRLVNGGVSYKLFDNNNGFTSSGGIDIIFPEDGCLLTFFSKDRADMALLMKPEFNSSNIYDTEDMILGEYYHSKKMGILVIDHINNEGELFLNSNEGNYCWKYNDDNSIHSYTKWGIEYDYEYDNEGFLRKVYIKYEDGKESIIEPKRHVVDDSGALTMSVIRYPVPFVRQFGGVIVPEKNETLYCLMNILEHNNVTNIEYEYTLEVNNS